ncbi:peptidoglycan editing factor PgeF [Sulfurospirillum oryzae]|uniref:peptidoglycan editing factor PgeF n=1 Tax=Sulfurospirillum oryzae TaxID=2976535 RepID=UPI0021E8719F|nr:peptidoglycan editing factor PgeF [Sulfurospirillum oryzae]
MQHFFTNRFGGVSQPPFDSLNLGLHVNDTALHVKENRERLKAQLGVSKLVFMDQIHSDKIVLIETGYETPECDAMISNVPDVALAVMVADCIPILFYDGVHQAIGVAHAGRVGTRLHVGQKTAQAMCETFGSSLDEMKIWMGPSIHSCCYEVGVEATLGFEKFLHVKEGKYFLDLQNYNREAFLALGIKPENLTISDVCTCCDADYFSYRREKQTGRFTGVIVL